MRRAGAPVGGRLPSSTLRGAKKGLMETDDPTRIGILRDQREPKDLSSDQIRKPKFTTGTEAKKKLIATLPYSKFGPNNCNHRRLTFSNRNKNRCFWRNGLPLQDSNRQLETIRNLHNPFTINQMTFSNRPKKTEVRRAPKGREKARAREILRLWAGSSQETGRKNQRAGPPLRMTGERGWSKGNGNSDGKGREPAGRPRYERQRSLDA
jgi:hypothetical protein